MTDGTKPQILLVEDESTQRSFLTEVLDMSGYECETAASCAEGMAIFAKGKFACALIDLGLPDGSGLSLLEEFTKVDPCLVPIVLTGNLSADTVIDTLRQGAFDYLTKPVNITTLKAALSRALSHYSVVRERAELFRLLLEEREQLRARVEAATADIRQYASACERSNSRLRALLKLTQLSSSYYSEEELLAGTFAELLKYLPLRCIALCNVPRRRLMAVSQRDGGEIRSINAEGAMELEDAASVLLESEPEILLRACLERNSGLDMSGLVSLVLPQTHRNTVSYVVGFYLSPEYVHDAADQEFLDMCARFLTYEWEQANLLLHVAHQASLGNIGMELARNFIQPLTAIRTAADFVNEAVISPEAAEGISIIGENVERLRLQTQEFRKLSTMREGSVETVRLDEYVDQALEILSVAIQNRRVTFHREIETDCECVLLNGTLLARTFLDLLLGALRTVDIGRSITIRLRDTDKDRIAFELVHDYTSPMQLRNVNSSLLPAALEKDNPGLQLAERTVHSCGGRLSVEFQENRRCLIRVVLPRNATSLGTGREDRR